MTRLPDFIAVGPQRTATTWLYEALRGRVGFPAGVKETMFFDRHYDKGLAWYAAHFARCPKGLPAGEIAPTYFHSSVAFSRIKEHLPHIKIICTLREPVARMYSLYKMMREYGMTRLGFEDALDRHLEIIESTRYATHLRKWLDSFGETQVLVMLHDDLRINADSYLKEICAFIGIPPFAPGSRLGRPNEGARSARLYHLARFSQAVADMLRAKRLYAVLNIAKRLGLRRVVFGGGEQLPPPDGSIAAHLRAKLRDEIEALEELLGRDLSSWKDGTARGPTGQRPESHYPG